MTVPKRDQVELAQKPVNARRGTTSKVRGRFPAIETRKVENRVKV
jgi:hypothetical protein